MRNSLLFFLIVVIYHNDSTAQVSMANSARDVTNNYFVLGKRFGSNLQQLAECGQTTTDDAYVCEDLYIAMNYSNQAVTPHFTFEYNGVTYNLDIFRWRVDVFLYPNGTTPLSSFYFPNDGTSYPFTFRIVQPGQYRVLLSAEIDGNNDGAFTPTSPVTPTSDFNGIFCVEVNAAGNVVPSVAEINIQNHPSLEFTTVPSTTPCIDKTICFSTDADVLTMQQYGYFMHYNTSGNPDDISNNICSNDCQQDFCYNFSDYGNYSMFMLSGTGFCYHELDLTVNPSLSSTIEPSIVSECSNTSIVTQVSAMTAQGYPPYTYEWSSSAGILGNQSTANLFMSNISDGTYDVTVTDNLGCQSVASFEVEANLCCINSSDFTISNVSATELAIEKPYLFVDPFATPLVLEPSPTNVDFTINNVFTIDRDMVINFANLQMGENTHIAVLSGVSLTINQVTASSCGNMWQGITVKDGGSLEILNSNIQDAIQAVAIEANASYRIENSTFDNNLNGFFITGTANGNINDCQFTNTSSTLLPPHAGRPSECGIEAWTTDIEIGPGNVFDGLRTGIKLWLTNANIYECTFQNLVTDPLNQFYTGVGIYAQGDFGIGNPAFAQYGLNVYGMGKDAATPNFSNLRTGIMLRNMNAKTITENYMSGVAFGIRAQLCHGASLNFDRNRYANVSNTGVLLSNNIGADAKIFESNFTGQKQFVEPTGVQVEGFGNKESNLVIGLNRFDRFTYGVRMNKVSGPDDYMESLGAIVWNNDFYSTLSGLANNIHLTACSRLAIDENYIEGKAAAATTNPNSAAATDKQYGIFLQNTTDYQLRCNNFDNLSSAIYAYGSNPTGKDNITTNQMHRHYYGWNMRRFGLDGELGTIGSQQFGNRNDFNDGLSNYHTGVQIWGHNNIAHLPNTIYRLTQDGLASVSSNNGNLPFNLIQAQGSLGECVSIPEGDLEFLIDDENMYEELQAIEVVNGYLTQTADPAFQGVIDFEAKRRIYKTLEQDTTLMQSSATLSDFYNQSRFQTLGKLREIEKELALLSDTAVLQDSVQVISIRQSIRSKRQSITGVSTHEANEKQMLALFEEKVLNADDRFTTEEQQLIASLAHQCPLVAGNGVYLARSLYSLFAEDNEFNDGVICDGYYKKESSFVEQNTITEPTLHIFPNPANKLALFVYYLPSTMTGYNEISLYTMEGRKLFAQSVLTGGSSIAFDVSNLANGLYLVEFRNGNSVVRSEKLSVNH